MQGITSTRLGDIYVRREADIVKVRERVRHLARETADALAHLHDVGLAPDVDVAETCRGDALHGS